MADRKVWRGSEILEGGLVCRKCGCRHFCVIYTRPAPDGKVTRRRECRHCGKRMTTIEQEK